MITFYYNIFFRTLDGEDGRIIGETESGLPIYANDKGTRGDDNLLPIDVPGYRESLAEQGWVALGKEGIRARQEELHPGYLAVIDKIVEDGKAAAAAIPLQV